MSYRSPLVGIYPNDLTDKDRHALESHCGRQNNYSFFSTAPKKLNYCSISSVEYIADSWIRAGLNVASGKFDPIASELFILANGNAWT